VKTRPVVPFRARPNRCRVIERDFDHAHIPHAGEQEGIYVMCEREGELRIKEGEVAEDGMLLGMDWYIKGIDAERPK